MTMEFLIKKLFSEFSNYDSDAQKLSFEAYMLEIEYYVSKEKPTLPFDYLFEYRHEAQEFLGVEGVIMLSRIISDGYLLVTDDDCGRHLNWLFSFITQEMCEELGYNFGESKPVNVKFPKLSVEDTDDGFFPVPISIVKVGRIYQVDLENRREEFWVSEKMTSDTLKEYFKHLANQCEGENRAKVENFYKSIV